MSRPEVVIIGASEGGPEAINCILNNIPDTFTAPIIVVQHMPEKFLPMFAEKLNVTSCLNCKIAEQFETVKERTVYIAPGNIHLSLAKQGDEIIIILEDTPEVNHCKPSIDKALKSTLKARIKAMAAILTGTGYDGAQGVKEMFNSGHKVIIQSEATSEAWGMPHSAIEAGVRVKTTPLDRISSEIIGLF